MKKHQQFNYPSGYVFSGASWLYPYIWMVLSSFKQSADIYTTGLFGSAYSLDNYRFCLKTVAGWKNLF